MRTSITYQCHGQHVTFISLCSGLQWATRHALLETVTLLQTSRCCSALRRHNWQCLGRSGAEVSADVLLCTQEDAGSNIDPETDYPIVTFLCLSK
jgi:hypothetical protein